MPSDPIYDEISATTYQEVYPRVIEDLLFRDTPFLAYLRDHAFSDFTGGSSMLQTFRYAPLIGGFYSIGDSFNLAKRQTLANTQFDPRYAEANITLYKEEIQVLNVGPLAFFSLIDEHMSNAIQTLNAIIAIAGAQYGQGAAATITPGRSTAINGWDEALNDGISPGWEGNIYPTYGGGTRNGVTTSALNSVPYFCGDVNGNPGIISYNIAEETYQNCCRGPEEPNLGVGNKAVVAFIKERMQTQQRFAQEKDPIWGVSGFRFNSAIILKDDYFPSLKYGVNDPNLGNYLTSTFTMPAGASPNWSANNPAPGTTITVGEVFAWLNTKKWKFRLSNDPEYDFGFGGFVPEQGSTRVCGQIKFAGNMYCTAPWANAQIFGIGG